ncbi:succinoglycan biosynthesis transport protein ExoP [Bradyrhizobium sp. LB7.2]
MRLAFWRGGKDRAVVERAVSKAKAETKQAEAKRAELAPRIEAKPAPVAPTQQPVESGDIDLHALGAALARKRGWIIVPTVLALVASVAIVNLVTPRYKSESRILIDGRENVFLRPNSDRAEERQALDAEAVTSQVQLVLSRDLAREIIKKNKLAERPEFDPVLQGISPLKSLAALVGIGRDPFSMTPEERVLDAYYERLQAYAVDKSRVIVIEFQSADPDLAARVANSIADGYLVLQQDARQDQARNASQWYGGRIDELRRNVSEAEAKAEDFRSKSSLFIGTNNTTLSNQQMGEVNTQLNNARALKADAEAKARLIREMIQSGKPIESSEVLNSESMRTPSQQRVALRAQLAEQSSTLLGNHPRIKELKAQLADLDTQIRDEAAKLARTLENDARAASGRVQELSASLEQLKKQATSTNGQDVQLRALEREAKAQRDLLETYLAKYREANTRETIDTAPTDGRIISRAIVSNMPAYPKKLPIVLIATIATLLLSSGVVVTGELLRQTAPRAVAVFTPAQTRASARQEQVVQPMVIEPFVDPVMAEPAPLQPEMTADADVSEFAEIERLAASLPRRRGWGEESHGARHRSRRSRHAVDADTGPVSRARCAGCRGRSCRVLADHGRHIRRRLRPRPCRADAGRGVIRANHHPGQALAAASGLGRPSRLRSQSVAVAAGDPGGRRAAARLRPRAARCRQRLRPAGRTADGECPRRRGARRVDGVGCARANVRAAQRRRLQRSHDAEQAGAAVECGGCAARRGGVGKDRLPERSSQPLREVEQHLVLFHQPLAVAQRGHCHRREFSA